MPRYPDPISFTKSLLGPQNRRDFLKRVTGAAVSAALPKLPGASAAPSAPAVAVLNPADVVPPAFNAGFWMPDGGQIVAHNGVATLMHSDGDLHLMGKPEFMGLKKILEEAGQSVPVSANGNPLFYNRLTKQWHEQASKYPPTGWRTHWLKAGKSAPEGHGLFDHSPYLRKEIPSAISEGGALNPSLLGSPDAPKSQIEMLEKQWKQDRRAWAEYQADGDARQIDPEILEESGLTPGGRFEPLAGLTASREVPLPIEQPRQPYMSKARKAAAAAPFLAVPLLAPREEKE